MMILLVLFFFLPTHECVASTHKYSYVHIRAFAQRTHNTLCKMLATCVRGINYAENIEWTNGGKCACTVLLGYFEPQMLEMY